MRAFVCLVYVVNFPKFVHLIVGFLYLLCGFVGIQHTANHLSSLDLLELSLKFKVVGDVFFQNVIAYLLVQLFEGRPEHAYHEEPCELLQSDQAGICRFCGPRQGSASESLDHQSSFFDVRHYLFSDQPPSHTVDQCLVPIFVDLQNFVSQNLLMPKLLNRQALL